jgi:hypothetical protein
LISSVGSRRKKGIDPRDDDRASLQDSRPALGTAPCRP